MSDSFTEEIKILNKTLRSEAFRFIIIQYNLSTQITVIKSKINEAFPDRQILTIKTANISYRELMDKIYHFNKGIIFIDDFENILKDKELYAGLNQRRDKIASLPLALVCFLPTGKNIMKLCVNNIPDLWSFRSLYIDIKTTVKTKISIEKNVTIIKNKPE